MIACIYIPDFPVCAVTRSEPALAPRAVAIVDGTPPAANVVAMNERAYTAGVKLGMPKLTVAGIASVEVRHCSPAAEASAHAALLDLGLAFSPRVEETALDTVVLDLAGLDRLIGPSEEAAHRLAKRASELGLAANITLAANPDAAVHAARGFPGVTLIPAGEESERLGPLPVEVLAPPPETLDTLRRWGVHTLRALAALPTPELSERLGQLGVALQELARGATSRLLVPAEAALHFEEAMELEYPVELLEPLAFILGRLLDQLCARLSARSLATNEIRLQLGLSVVRGPWSVAEDNVPQDSRTEIQNSKFKIQNLKSEIRKSRIEAVKSESENRNSKFETKTSKLETGSSKPDSSNSSFIIHPSSFSSSPQSPVPSPSSEDNHSSTIRLPVPTRNSKLLLKLLLLNLQSDPPPAPVVKVTLAAEPVKPRVAQGGLFLPLSPDPEKLELTLARIAGVVGKGNVGSPELVDTHRPGAFRMKRFQVEKYGGLGTGFGIRGSGFANKDRGSGLGVGDSQKTAAGRPSSSANPEPRTPNPDFSCESRAPSPESRIPALRLFRPPLQAKVEVRDGRPVQVDAFGVRGDVVLAAGPWHTSGDWWTDEPWDREEWDIALSKTSVVRGPWSVAGHWDLGSGVRGSQTTQDGQRTTLYRIHRDLKSGGWFVEGIYD
ncbi:MAG TPA: DNA polymerase Y family protein [Terriglobia bacterium]|nr:DNA polymerase Y family protein [Terriglobia bacterium]